MFPNLIGPLKFKNLSYILDPQDLEKLLKVLVCPGILGECPVVGVSSKKSSFKWGFPNYPNSAGLGHSKQYSSIITLCVTYHKSSVNF